MNIAMVILRLIHIVGGVVWAGGTISMVGFISPSAKAVGKDSAKFMQQLAFRSIFGPTMAVTAVLTTLSGVIMYWLVFGAINITSTSGLMLTIGGILGIVSFLMGFTTQKSGTDKMKSLAEKMAAAGGPPQPEQLAEMATLQENQAKSGAIMAVILVLTISFMTMSEWLAL